MAEKVIRRVSKGYHYFFVKPRKPGNVHKVAERLMRIDNVKEVSVTEGEYGFVVKAHESEEEEKVVGQITKVVGGNTIKALCHYRYIRP